MPRTACWIVFALLAAAAPAAAQLTGSNVSPLGGTSIDNSFGGTGSGSNSNGLNSPTGQNSLTNTQAFIAPQIGGFNPLNATLSPFVNQSNAFGLYYANPYYQGRAGATFLGDPGGFGGPLNGVTQGISSVNTNAFSAAAGSTPISSATGFGGNAGTNFTGGDLNNFGGSNNRNNPFGNNNNNNNNRNAQSVVGGVIVPLSVPITYTSKLMFAPPPVTAPALATDVRQMLDRSNSIAAPGMIDVFTNGQVVVLRGLVASVEEAQTAEGMIRLTPGVRNVVNELKVQTAVAPKTPTP